jgi:hypothetical protein
MAELVVTTWLRPHLAAERQELERLSRRWEEIEEMSRWHSEIHMWHPCVSSGCPDCATYGEYLEMVAADIREIQDRVHSAVALTVCCSDM